MKVKKDKVTKIIERELVPDYIAAGWKVVEEPSKKSSLISDNNDEK
jgi:hypothetical protein